MEASSWLAAFFTVAALAVPGNAPALHRVPGAARQDAVPADGGPCLACGSPVHADGTTFRYRGRVVRICAKPGCQDAWAATPELLFSQLQPHSALFDEPADPPRPVSWNWFLVGGYTVFALVCAGATSYVAVTRGRAPLPWFLAGLLGTVVALAVVCFRSRENASELPQGIPPGLRKVPTTRSPALCPACGAANHPAASACTSCGKALDPAVDSEARRALRG